MDEVCILAVYLKDIQKHLPDQGGQGEYLAIDAVAAQLTGGRHIERNTDEQNNSHHLMHHSREMIVISSESMKVSTISMERGMSAC